MEQYKELFARLDADKDGKITPKEIIAIANVMGLKPKEDIINEAFHTINMTGKLEVTEPLFLFNLLCRVKCPSYEPELKKIFKIVDANKDGFIQFDEMWAVVEKFKAHTKEETLDMFNKFDANKDNKLELDEFKAMVKSSPKSYASAQAILMFMKRCPYLEAFRKIDTNGDGKILPEEVKAIGDKVGLNKPIEKYYEYLSVVNPLHKPELDMALFVKLLQERMADKSKLKELKRFFAFLDTNKDGKVDANELNAFVEKLGISHSKAKVEAAFKVYDTNNDGFIDAKEFAEFIVLHENVRIAIHALLMLTQDCPYKKAFEYFDTDHNGKITVPELVEISKKLKVNWNEEKATKVLTALNPMGVAEVAEDLFYAILKLRLECPCAEKDLLEAFKFIDNDHNGYLTPKEVMAFIALLLGEKAMSYEKVISAIYKFDSNGDLKISPCEFMTMVNGNLKVKIALQSLLMFMTAGNKCCEK